MTRMIADGLQKTLSVAAAIINWRPTAGLSPAQPALQAR